MTRRPLSIAADAAIFTALAVAIYLICMGLVTLVDWILE
jgi:hypothetical protein